MSERYLLESLASNLGRTVTIFTTSGGLSGGGFTGVLAAVNESAVKLITDIGAAPACALGSSCGSPSGLGGFGGCGCGSNNWLGSVTEIPICKIAGFTHSAI
ncbi:MAG: hypothetical protein LBS21_07930 [Clostridiales bacterium]|nr:hypothetical protein [Clostridiales bacterium]